MRGFILTGLTFVQVPRIPRSQSQWAFRNFAVSVEWAQRYASSLIFQLQFGSSHKSIKSQKRFLRPYGEPHDGFGRQIRHVDCVGSKTHRADWGSRVGRVDAEALELGPGVSVPDLHFERKENVWSGGVIFDFKSHCRYVAGLNTSHMPNCDVLRRLTGNGEEQRDEKKNRNQNHNDGLGSHIETA